MSGWLSVADLVRSLGLNASSDDRKSIRDEIRRRISAIHPDHNGGAFATPEARSQYEDLVAALAFLDTPLTTALIPVSEVPALIAAIRQAFVPAGPVDASADQARAEYREIARADASQRVLLPRIGSGAFAALCTFVLTVGDTFRNDALLGGLTESRSLLFNLLLCSVVAFLATWWVEQQERNHAEWLATEMGRRHVLKTLFNRLSRRHDGLQDEKPTEFSFSDLVETIAAPKKPEPMNASTHRLIRLKRRLSAMGNPRLSIVAAEKLAKPLLDDLVSRGVVRRLPDHLIEDHFQMNIANVT